MIGSWQLPALDHRLQLSLQAALDAKTKPLGSLGRLEELALRLGLIQGSSRPQIDRPTLIVFAGDHGLCAEAGVSPYPQAVTQAMVRNFASGGAAINVLARQLGWQLQIVDSGVAEVCPFPEVEDLAIARSTKSCLRTAAMTVPQYHEALSRGAHLMRKHFDQGTRLLACGDMGIGNSSAAALILHELLGMPLETVISRGAGCDDLQLTKKLHILEKVVAQHGTLSDPELVLQHYAGFEMVMAVGAMLEAARLRVPVLVDGLILSSAVYAAIKVQPRLADFLIFAHRSSATGHDALLADLGVTPLLDLGMRLGEGTGAALALPIVQSAVAILNEMATFASADVPTAHEMTDAVLL